MRNEKMIMLPTTAPKNVCETDRQTDRQSERERTGEREGDRARDTQTERVSETDRQTETQREGENVLLFVKGRHIPQNESQSDTETDLTTEPCPRH